MEILIKPSCRNEILTDIISVITYNEFCGSKIAWNRTITGGRLLFFKLDLTENNSINISLRFSKNWSRFPSVFVDRKIVWRQFVPRRLKPLRQSDDKEQ